MEIKEIDNNTGAIEHSQSEVENLLIYLQSINLKYPAYFDDQARISFRSSTSIENDLNQKRLVKLEKELTDKLKLLILEDSFEYGYENRADILVKEQMNINNSATKEWLNNIFAQNYSDENLTIGILRLVARIDLADIEPQGSTMAMAALSHKNEEIQECGIRAFESWSSSRHLNILKTVRVTSSWLKDYLKSVIKDIESEHAVVG